MTFSLGVLGVPLPTVSRVQSRHLEAVALLGVSSVGLYMSERERRNPNTWAARLSQRLQESRLRLLYVVGALGNLIADDRDVRRRAVQDTARGLSAARVVGAERLLIGPGGFSPKGPWWYHPANFGVQARTALVRSISELARHAGEVGVGITIEGHQTTVLESPAVMRAILDEVDSPVVGGSLDYVNFLTPPTFARFDTSLREMADVLGPRLTAIHVKDAVVRPRLALHIDERPPGDGELELAEVLALAHRRGLPAVLEHLPRLRAMAAIGHVAGLAADLREPRSSSRRRRSGARRP